MTRDKSANYFVDCGMTWGGGERVSAPSLEIYLRDKAISSGALVPWITSLSART